MRRALRGASILGSAVLVGALSCGTAVDLGATRADLPGGASNDAGGGTSGSGGFSGTEGSGGTTDLDAAFDAPADTDTPRDGVSPFCPQLYPVWEVSPLACETLLPQPWTAIAPPSVFRGVNLLYRSPLGEERVIGYVDSEAACADVVDGWYLVNPLDPRRIVLCPETCAAILADGGRLFTALGCSRIPAELR